MQKIIVGLVGLNLVFAGFLGVTLLRRSAAPGAATASESDPADSTAGGNAGVKPLLAGKTPAKGSQAIWASIASTDLRKYAANLRRAGCPEETINEILLAEVNRLYGPRERALKVRPEDLAPWEEASQRDRRGAEMKLRDLLAEKRNLLKELTGVDVGINMPSRLAGREVEPFEIAFSALPETKRDQVRAIQEKYWAQSDEIKQRTVGYLEPEDREEFLRIKSERRAELAKIVTPKELQDYELQTSATAPALRSRFEGFEVSDEEFRKIFDYMQPQDEKFSLSRRNPDPVNPEFTAAREQAEKDLLEQIHQVLGDERYTEYQRTRDPVYRTLRQVGNEAGVPQESILQAYQAQQQMQEEAKRLLQDPNITPEQRTAGFQQMQAQGEQMLQQLFGDKSKQILQRLQGDAGNPRFNQRYGIGVGGDRVQVIPPGGGNPAPIVTQP
jgi:hypothetical protein